jgi:hypothetical protein
MVLSKTAVSRVKGILWKEFEDLQHRGFPVSPARETLQP